MHLRLTLLESRNFEVIIVIYFQISCEGVWSSAFRSYSFNRISFDSANVNDDNRNDLCAFDSLLFTSVAGIELLDQHGVEACRNCDGDCIEIFRRLESICVTGYDW